MIVMKKILTMGTLRLQVSHGFCFSIFPGGCVNTSSLSVIN
jgi:hypothetical protein